MDDHGQGRKRWRKGLWPVLFLAAFLLLLLVVPPLVSISRYKSRVTRLISDSLGRPVRLSSVELRMFPWPGFEITNLSVAEDPAYGTEPVLHANSVRASIRLLSLWRGRLEIGTISVDEASLNVVHSGPGQWNLDPLFRTAVAHVGSASQSPGSRRKVPFPYLEATDSRINFKQGTEKLPFSLVNAEFELWQQSPGDWQIRLRAQPARTDLSLYQEDTGVVRLEASMQHAPSLRQMPIRLDLDWRDAQLGQLSRLLLGADPGWRGGLTGNLHLEGTADSAHIITRLRAEGVHRAEFAPAEPLDFDANCDLLYHFTRRTFENLVCNSPVGDGRVHITGNRLSPDLAPQLTVELDRVPVGAGLGLLRTVRSGFPPDLQASGRVSGKIEYDAAVPSPNVPAKPPRSKYAHPLQPTTGPLIGSLTLDGLTLTGGGLTQPIQVPKAILEPVLPQAPNQRIALAGSVAVPLGGTLPMTVAVRLTLADYSAEWRGQASMPRARELANAAGLLQTQALEGLAGDPLIVDLTARGPWIVQEQPAPAAKPEPPSTSPARPQTSRATKAAAPPNAATSTGDTLFGTISLHNANWRADFLAGHLQIAQATLNLAPGQIRWDPVAFTYGPLKGTGTLVLKTNCPAGETCRPQFTVALGALDAADLQTAILGAHQKGTLLSSFIDRLHPSTAPAWPELDGTISADSLVLGPVTLNKPSAEVEIVPAGAQITSISAGLLGGRLAAAGSFTRAATDQDKPAYSFNGKLQNLSAAAVGQLLGQRWSGGVFEVGGKIDLSGYTASDLARSAKGSLQFEWARGAINSKAAVNERAAVLPAALTRFDRWSGDAAIASGVVTLGENQVMAGSHQDSVAGSVTFGDPPEVALSAPKRNISSKPAH